MKRLVAWLAQWKWAVFAASAALFILGGMGMQRVVFDPDVLVYFDRSMPERVALETMEQRFGRTNEIVFVLRSRDDASMLSPARHEAMQWLQGKARALKEAIAVRSPLTLPSEDGNASAAPDPAEIRRAAAEAGFSARSVISEDETVAAVAVLFPRSSRGDISIDAVTTAAQQLQAEFRERYPDIEVLMTGRLMMDRAFLTESQQEIYQYAAMQIAVLALVLLITFRSVAATFTLMAMVLITGPVTMGAVGWLGVPLNGISSAASTVLLGLAVATGVHIVLAWQKAVNDGEDRQSAVTTAMTANAAPVTLSVVTTIVSFLCLNFAASPPFGQLGNVVSLGLVFVLILSFTLLPALLLVIPVRVGREGLGLAPVMGRLGRFVIRKSRILFSAFILSVAMSVGGIAQISFDDTFSHYFDERFEVRRATDLFEEKLSGTVFIDFSVPVAAGQDPFGYGYLALEKRFVDWMRDQPEFADVLSLYTIAERMGLQDRLQQAAGETDLRGRVVLEQTIRNAYEKMRAEGLIRLVDATERHARFNVVLRGVSSAETLDFTQRAKAQAEAMFGAPILATGLPILSAQLSIDSTRTMLVSMILALTGVSLLMLIALRNVRLGLISLLPNILPAVAAMGLWGFFVGEVSFAATVVGALTFGIVVDDTVHMMMKYQAARQRGDSPRRAIQSTVRSVGVAVLVTSVALSLSFAVFIFSGFLVNQHLGWLTALTLIIALIADLLFLPPLLLRADRPKAPPLETARP
jgi:predicted RND superfamily exporter protein